MRVLPLFIVVSLSSGCFAPTTEADLAQPLRRQEKPAREKVLPPRAPEAPVTVRPPQHSRTCSNAGESCETDANCCGDTFCFNFTYSPWVCVGRQPNGSECFADSQCASGSCPNYVCAASECLPLGSECAGDDDCCAGSFCRTMLSYVPDPAQCVAAYAAGTRCYADRECLSVSCVNHACAP